MSNKYHIYVPSKGRASNCLTALVLQAEKIPFTILVEPQDYKEYAEYFPKEVLHKIPKNDQGIAYVRNQALSLSRKRGEKHHWQMDDDIRKFMIYKDGKKIAVSALKSIKAVEKEYDKYSNVGMIAHRYTSYAFAQKTDTSINKNPCSSFLLRNDMKAKWNKDTVVDADFALQILNQDWTTIIMNRELIDTVPPMKQAGGLTDSEYAGDGRFNRFTKLSEDWPGCFKVVRDEDGKAKLRHMRCWAKFTEQPKKKKRGE